MKSPAIDIALPGCAPVPLAHYLKALGILRLVSKQCDTNTKCFWKNDIFHLVSKLDRDALEKFFLNEYHPTPIIAPWNGGSGFHPDDNKEAIDAIIGSSSDRFDAYRAAICDGRNCLDQLGLHRKPEKEEKQPLLQICRNQFFGDALQAFDTAVMLTGDSAKFPPLVGTGWNDGRLEFTNNFMQRLIDVIDPATGSASAFAKDWLKQSLFSENIKAPPSKAPVGQFLPGTAGGANGTAGFDAKSSVNPWDFILMIEGTLLFFGGGCAQTRICGTGPACVSVLCPAGWRRYASASLADEASGMTRGEMWMPLCQVRRRSPS